MPAVTHRTVVLSLFGLLTLGSCVALVNALISPNPNLITIFVMVSAIVTNIALITLYARGWDAARYLYLVLTTVLVGSVPQIAHEQ